MGLRAVSVGLTGLSLSLVVMAAIAGPFDGITVCHDMAHLSDVGLSADKAERAHPQDGNKTFCQAPPGIVGVRVCMTGPILDLGDEVDSHYTLSYEVDGKTLHTWSESGPELVDPYSFTVESADLGGDGRLDTIVGVMEAVSNGFPVEGWELYVIPADGQKLIGPVGVENYTVISGLFQVPGRQGCVLLASKWDADTEPGRGQGTYAKGHWYILDGDKLVNYSQLPAVERRLLDSFWAELSIGGQPVLWFKSPKVQVLKN